MNKNVAAVVLAAGKGSRMKSDLPKAMMPVAGKPMIRHILDTLDAMRLEKIVVVTSPDGELVRKEIAPHAYCIQDKQLGTGHAVACAKEVLKGFNGKILVVYCDHPIITQETFSRALNKLDEGYSVVVLGFTPDDALRYGRLKMKGDELEKIVEYKDASDEEKAIRFCNSGVMAFDGKVLFDILSEIKSNNAAGEFYLTDAVEIARKKGLKCSAIETSAEEVAGANTQEELAQLEIYLQHRKAG